MKSERTMTSSVRRCGILSACLLALMVLAACVTEPITQRRTLAPIVPESAANEMGASAYGQILREEERSSNPRYHRLVDSVGRRIAAVTDRRMKNAGRTLYNWEFTVLKGPDIPNAFALPGGKVAFYEGIIPICRDEDGIAVVMAHEIAHAFAEHGRRRLSQAVLADFGLNAVQLALASENGSELADLATAALGVGYQVGVSLPFSRADEAAADEIGLTLMAEAGYDPRAAVDFWKRMEKATGPAAQPPAFLSTHPTAARRIARLREMMPEALEIYRSVRSGRESLSRSPPAGRSSQRDADL